MKILPKSLWNISRVNQIGIIEGKVRTYGIEMLVTIDLKKSTDRDQLISSYKQFIQRYPELRTIWLPEESENFSALPAATVEHELQLADELLRKDQNEDEVYGLDTHATPQSTLLLPFRVIGLNPNKIAISGLHTHFSGASLYVYTDLFLHCYFVSVGLIGHEVFMDREAQFQRCVPKWVAWLNTLQFPVKILSVYAFLATFGRKAQKRTLGMRLPSWSRDKKTGEMTFCRREWQLSHDDSNRFLALCRSLGLSPTQYLVKICAEEFMQDANGARKGCFFYVSTSEIHRTPGASLLHLGTHVGSFMLQFLANEDVVTSIKKQWHWLKVGVPYWLMVLLRIRMGRMDVEIEKAQKTKAEFLPHQLDSFSNADLVVANNGKAPHVKIHDNISNITAISKPWHYPILCMNTFSEKITFDVCYNKSIFKSELMDKFVRIMSKLESDIETIEPADTAFVKKSKSKGFSTVK